MTKNNLMRPGEVALLFNVDPRTVSRWAEENKLMYVRTPGGQRRYIRAEVEAFFERTFGGRESL